MGVSRTSVPPVRASQPPPSRAVADTAAVRAAPDRGAPATGRSGLTGRIRPGCAGTVGLARLVLIELVVAAVLAAMSLPAAGEGAADMAAALVPGAALGRSRGRWWTELAILRWRRRQRQRWGPDPAAGPLAGLRALAPGLEVTEVGS